MSTFICKQLLLKFVLLFVFVCICLWFYCGFVIMVMLCLTFVLVDLRVLVCFVCGFDCCGGYAWLLLCIMFGCFGLCVCLLLRFLCSLWLFVLHYVVFAFAVWFEFVLWLCLAI